MKNLVIVVFSVFFLAWGNPVFIWYVIAGTAIDYAIIRLVLARPDFGKAKKQIWLALAILINLGALLFFKYANFFVDQIQPLLSWAGLQKPSWYGIALPFGISFIAFHKISFVIDIYKGRTSPPRSFSQALLYILFFPQLIAGPIIRSTRLEQIIFRNHNTENVLIGFFRFACGSAKKVLVADQAGRAADAVFNMQPDTLPIEYVWIGVLAYTIQIYFDFSGYSDMAIGLGRVCGFHFREFQSTIHGSQHHGVLAALAYHVVKLDEALSVYSAGRKSGSTMATLFQPLDRIFAFRIVAWRSLELRSVGGISWFPSHRGKVLRFARAAFCRTSPNKTGPYIAVCYERMGAISVRID